MQFTLNVMYYLGQLSLTVISNSNVSLSLWLHAGETATLSDSQRTAGITEAAAGEAL